MQGTIFWILILVLPLIHAELVQVIQVARHGARTPNSFEFLPNQYTERSGELTILGIVQEYFLGREMRKRYVEDLKFIPENFNSSEVVIKSSWKNRTVRSAFAFANGLYPQNSGTWLDNKYAENFPVEKLLPLRNKQNKVERDDIRQVQIDEEWARNNIEIVSMDRDFYFHATKGGNCEPAEQVLQQLKKGPEYQELERYFGLTAFTQLASGINKAMGFNLLNPEKMSLKTIKSVLDNYRCNTFHGNDHPDIDEQTLKILISARQKYAYKFTLLDDMVRSVLGSKLLEEFFDYTTAASSNASGAPKFIFYSAHDTTLEILFSMFLLETKLATEDQYNIIPFSSVLSIELHKEQETVEGLDGLETQDAYYVKMLFNDEPQLVKWCGGYKCSLSQFHKILKHNTIPSLEDFCSAGRMVSTPTPCADESICHTN